MVSFDIFWDSPKKDDGNRYILLVVDLFRRHAEPYAITSAEKIAKGCASKLANDDIPRWRCLNTLLSDRGAEFVSAVCREVFEMMGAKKRHTSSLHPQTNGTAERLNHTVRQMPSYLIADIWEEIFIHAAGAHNDNASRGIGLAPNDSHLGRYSGLPMTILEGQGVRGYQGCKKDQLEQLELMRNR